MQIPFVKTKRTTRYVTRFTFAALFVCTFLFAGCAPIEETASETEFSFGSEYSVEYTEYAPGAVVGKLELSAPATSPFVLRATLPLQPGQYTGQGATSPFVIVDSSGRQTPAQVEIVGRFANASDGADVVELISRVERPAGVSPGQRTQYFVKLVQHPTGPALTPLPVVATLMNTPSAFVLRTKDVFGHAYSANLGADFGTPREVVMRNGEVARQVRTYETLMPDAPVGGNGGTLPHMMGVHAYFTTWSNAEFVSLDLRVNNGASGKDQSSAEDDPLGDVYFENLELVIPQGWTLLTAFDNPYFGSSYAENTKQVWPIVAPLTGNKLHFMPSQAQFHRRMVLCRTGAETAARECLEERNLAFCQPGTNAQSQPYLSWWNAASARYFPQNLPLPILDRLNAASIRNEHNGTLISDANQVRNGTAGSYPVEFPVLGWAHPRGAQFGGEHGGYGIHLYDGVRIAYAASGDGYRRNQLWHRMTVDRNPTALYNKNGEPTTSEDWIKYGPNGPYMSAWVWLRPQLDLGDPFGYGSTPSFQRQAVVSQGRTPSYQNALSGFQIIDSEHLIRVTRMPKTLAWLGNDAISKDDLALQSELSRMSYNPLPQDASGTNILTGFAHDREFVDEYPNQGFRVNRAEGWYIDTIVADYALATPARRAVIRPWFDEMLDMFELGQSSCMGLIGALPNQINYNGQYRTRQSISESIIENGLWGVRSSVYDGFDTGRTERLRQIIVRSTYSMISGSIWNPVTSAPYFQAAVGPYDMTLPLWCGWVPPDGVGVSDDYQTWSSLAYGYLLTGDTMFLARADQMAHYDLPGLQNKITGYLENGSPMLAIHQLLQQ